MSIEMLDQPVLRFTNHSLVTISSNLKASDASTILTESNLDSILVFKNNEIIGLLTQDILENISTTDYTKVILNKISLKPIIKIHQDSKVKEAIDLMKANDVQRLIVTNDKRPIGILSRKALVES